MAEACARLCTSGLSPSNQSTISVPTRQWRTLPRPGTFRSRIRAEAGEADDAARISVFNTLPIIMARSLGDYSMGEKRNLVYKTKSGKKRKWQRLPSWEEQFDCHCLVLAADQNLVPAGHCWAAKGQQQPVRRHRLQPHLRWTVCAPVDDVAVTKAICCYWHWHRPSTPTWPAPWTE